MREALEIACRDVDHHGPGVGIALSTPRVLGVLQTRCVEFDVVVVCVAFEPRDPRVPAVGGQTVQRDIRVSVVTGRRGDLESLGVEHIQHQVAVAVSVRDRDPVGTGRIGNGGEGEQVDIVVGVNRESFERDISGERPGGGVAANGCGCRQGVVLLESVRVRVTVERSFDRQVVLGVGLAGVFKNFDPVGVGNQSLEANGLEVVDRVGGVNQAVVVVQGHIEITEFVLEVDFYPVAFGCGRGDRELEPVDVVLAVNREILKVDVALDGPEVERLLLRVVVFVSVGRKIAVELVFVPIGAIDHQGVFGIGRPLETEDLEEIFTGGPAGQRDFLEVRHSGRLGQQCALGVEERQVEITLEVIKVDRHVVVGRSFGEQLE